MTVRLVPAAPAREAESDANDEDVRWSCTFVNNMPDAAFDSTERQFLELLDEGSGDEIVTVRRHTLDRVPRGERTAARIGAEYSPLEVSFDSPADLLIVTGSNPVEARIEGEPYWDDLVRLLTWGSRNVESMLLSCLSAHAALTIFDGCERIRLSSKCTGVFDQHVDVEHPIARQLDSEILVPHSRLNSVPQVELERAGYRIVVQSDDVGWGLATKQIGPCNVVLVQCHPEYDPWSLLREYHRDAGRYARSERDDAPVLPLHCAVPEDWVELEKLQGELLDGQRDPDLVEAFPFDAAGGRAPWPWRSMAIRLYANWLSSVKGGGG